MAAWRAPSGGSAQFSEVIGQLRQVKGSDLHGQRTDGIRLDSDVDDLASCRCLLHLSSSSPQSSPASRS